MEKWGSSKDGVVGGYPYTASEVKSMSMETSFLTPVPFVRASSQEPNDPRYVTVYGDSPQTQSRKSLGTRVAHGFSCRTFARLDWKPKTLSTWSWRQPRGFSRSSSAKSPLASSKNTCFLTSPVLATLTLGFEYGIPCGTPPHCLTHYTRTIT